MRRGASPATMTTVTDDVDPSVDRVKLYFVDLQLKNATVYNTPVSSTI
jgi:ribosomal protein L1